LAGGVAQLLEGRVRLWPVDFPCPMPDLWLEGDHFVDKLSAMGQSSRL